MQDNEMELSLPSTNLHVRGDNLVRLSDESGAEIFSIPITSIHSIGDSKTISPFGAMICGSACALCYIAFYVCESNTATVFLAVLAVILGGFGLISVLENRIKIKSEDGDFSIVASDSSDLINGFLISLKRKTKISRNKG